MNTERFLWPVIIAAGLHGALLLSFSDDVAVARPPKTKDTKWEPPHVPVDLTPPEAGDSGEKTGGPAPLDNADRKRLADQLDRFLARRPEKG